MDSYCWALDTVYWTAATIWYWRRCSGQLLVGTGECVVDSYCWVLENM